MKKLTSKSLYSLLSMRNKNALVIGGAGTIGSNYIKHLVLIHRDFAVDLRNLIIQSFNNR